MNLGHFPLTRVWLYVFELIKGLVMSGARYQLLEKPMLEARPSFLKNNVQWSYIYIHIYIPYKYPKINSLLTQNW
jgi:hypothetical protein